MELEEHEPGELLKLVGKRWNILLKLSENRYYVSKLARALSRSDPQISNELKELEKYRLVGYEQEKGQRFKYYYATDYAKKILTALNQATQLRPKEKFEEWKINELLNTLEDQNLSEDLRLSYSRTFCWVCTVHPREVIGNRRIRTLFKKVVKDPLRDKVTEDLMGSVPEILLHASRIEDGRKWVTETLYPILVKNTENKNEEIKVWAIIMVGEVAIRSIDPSVKFKVEEKFLEIWFSNETDPNSKFGKEVGKQLVKLVSQRLFKKVRDKTKNQEDKAKAEILLEKLRHGLLPKQIVVDEASALQNEKETSLFKYT